VANDLALLGAILRRDFAIFVAKSSTTIGTSIVWRTISRWRPRDGASG